MEITKDFLTREIEDLRSESRKAQAFLIQAEAAINAYTMLIRKLDEPDADPPQAPEARPEVHDS